MSNMNTVLGLYNLTGPTSATETAIAAVSGGTTRAVLGLPPDVAGGFFDGHPFRIRVVSQAQVTGAANFVSNLYWNSKANTNLTTFTSDVLILGTGNLAAASKWATTCYSAICMWDSVSQQLCSFWEAGNGVSNIPTTPAIVKATAVVTSTNPVTTALATPDLVQFFVTHSTSANPTSSKLLELSIERV